MSEKKITSIGGQAVIEGVMMRGPFKTAVAVRKPDGEIITKITENKVKGGFRKIPILRGIFGFINSMVIGINALMFSAQFYEEDGTPKEDKKEEEKIEKVEEENKEESLEERKKNKKTFEQIEKERKEAPTELSGFALALTIMGSLAISIGLFFILPNLIAGLLVPNKEDTLLYNIVESVVKIAIFLGYMALVSKMKDIQRVFEYHGAEHKTIFCFENREELTPENVMKYQRFHPRCGTSFLLFVVIISIIVYSIVGRHPVLIINVLIRLALLPLVAGISYEIIRFAGKHTENKFVSWLNKPGMLLQRLTTREPNASQIECAIAALKAVIPEDESADQW